MHDKELQAFVEGTVQYFKKITKETVTVGVPSVLKEDEDKFLSITAAIGVAGLVRGAICITAEKGFFSDLMSLTNPQVEQSDRNIIDLAGEVANTIAGNAQKAFGPDFRISVPLVITSHDNSSQIAIASPRYIIPIMWQEHKIYMIIGLG